MSGIDFNHALSQGITGFTYDKSIETSQNDSEFRAFNATSNDPWYRKLSNTNPLEAHNFHKAAAYGLNGDGTTVHIVDTGFNPNHSQLSQSDYQKDPINGFSNATGERDHGHQVMATIGANKGDGLTVGVAQNKI